MVLLTTPGGGLKCAAGRHQSMYLCGSHALKTQLETGRKRAVSRKMMVETESTRCVQYNPYAVLRQRSNSRRERATQSWQGFQPESLCAQNENKIKLCDALSLRPSELRRISAHGLLSTQRGESVSAITFRLSAHFFLKIQLWTWENREISCPRTENSNLPPVHKNVVSRLRICWRIFAWYWMMKTDEWSQSNMPQ